MLRVWGTYLKSYEKEAFLKSFLFFFLIQLFFLTVVMWQFYKSVSHKYDMKIMHGMTQCSYDFVCPDYTMDLLQDLEQRELNMLYVSKEYYMLFSLPNTQEYYLKLSLSSEKYQEKKSQIFLDVLMKYTLYSLVLLFISILFSYFSLRPLREALKLNDEFVKDMLHDINTPLSSLKINFKILQKNFGEDDAIKRSEEAMQSIHNLQANLCYFLSQSPLRKEKLDLKRCIEKRVKNFEVIFREIQFLVNIQDVTLKVNYEAFIRIVDNLLSNAAKYNVARGTVKVSFENEWLTIEDSGIGIKEPNKIFNRFYKETNRGLGIGLHVVQKLCQDLNIEIKVESQLKKGTKFSLNLEKVMFR